MPGTPSPRRCQPVSRSVSCFDDSSYFLPVLTAYIRKLLRGKGVMHASEELYRIGRSPPDAREAGGPNFYENDRPVDVRIPCGLAGFRTPGSRAESYASRTNRGRLGGI